jgi:hypothetical protein
MKNIILILAILFAPAFVGAQSIQKDGSGNYFQAKKEAASDAPATLESLTKGATKTGATFTTAKGEKFPVWLSKQGADFVVRTYGKPRK